MNDIYDNLKIRQMEDKKQLTEKDFEEAEKVLGFKFDKELKKFLLRYNGAYFEEFYITPYYLLEDKSVAFRHVDSCNLDSIFDLNYIVELSSCDIKDGVIPSKYLIFGWDSGETAFMICADESENAGKVYCSFRESKDNETGYFLMGEVADDFNDFMNSLVAADDDYFLNEDKKLEEINKMNLPEKERQMAIQKVYYTEYLKQQEEKKNQNK